jgi:hypothetical protein
MNKLSEREVAELIKEIVCIYFEAPKDVFVKKTRKSEYIKIKHTCCFLIKRHTLLSSSEIAEMFNLKNHSSIFLLIKKIEDIVCYDKEAKKELKELDEIIKFKGLSKNKRINFDEFYFINLDNFKSIRENSERAVIFIGYSDEEIKELMPNTELKTHENTKKFILENNEKTEGENNRK